MRLIDADDAPLYLNKTGVEQIRKMPTVDAVAVVRCKDCARRNPSCDLTNSVLCTYLHNLSMPKDGFCSYGERRKEE